MGGLVDPFWALSYEEDDSEESYTYDDYLLDRADEEYHRMKDEGEI